MDHQGQRVSENNKLVCQGSEHFETEATKFSKAGCKNYQKGSEALFHFQVLLSQYSLRTILVRVETSLMQDVIPVISQKIVRKKLF